MAHCDRFPLPKGWTKTIRSSVLHAVSLASAALTSAWAGAARNRRPRVQTVAELELWVLKTSSGPMVAGSGPVSGGETDRRTGRRAKRFVRWHAPPEFVIGIECTAARAAVS